MRRFFSAYLCGALFAVGLGFSQMTNPSKILGFLNLLGNWDPTLLVVFAGATGTFFIGYRLLIDTSIKAFLQEELGRKKVLDKKMLFGALCFGIGWGLIGLCPGPALTNLVTLKPAVLCFLAGMTLGMYSVKLFP